MTSMAETNRLQRRSNSRTQVFRSSGDSVPMLKAFVDKHSLTLRHGAQAIEPFPSHLGLTTSYSIRC